jgi:hypothetical protein
VPFDARGIHEELLIGGLDADSLVGVLPPFVLATLVAMIRIVNREPLAFYTWCYTCKKYKIDDKGHQLGTPCFLYVALRV